MTDKIQKEGLEPSVEASLALADSAIQLVDNTAMTKVEFDALAEKRIRDNAGSGFSEWGKSYSAAQGYINEGLWERSTDKNILRIGAGAEAVAGISRTDYPIAHINGVHHNIDTVVNPSTGFSTLHYPTAPDGTKTYNSATGVVVQHADTATAFASETVDNKVITSRQDYAFLESFHEKISDKDVVYPLGNVQYGVSTYEGIDLSNSLVAQGYSAFGEWDTTTTGYGVKWSTLNNADKITFLQDNENNIYLEDGELIQVRYRVRVIEGLGDEWKNINPNSQVGGWFSYRDASNERIRATGLFTTPQDFAIEGSATGLYKLHSRTDHTGQNGIFEINEGATFAHNGLCFAIPICLVQRRNQGAYEPTWNPNGCAKILWGDASTNVSEWYNSEVKIPSTMLDLFTFDSRNSNTNGNIPPFVANDIGQGSIGNTNGRSDNKFYDAIYASDVNDLRMSSKRLPHRELREKYKRMAIVGEVRGFEGVPFTTIVDLGVCTGEYASPYYMRLNTVGGVFFSFSVRADVNGEKNWGREEAGGSLFGYVVGKSTGLIYPVTEWINGEGGLDRVYLPLSLGDRTSEIATETVGWYGVVGFYRQIPLISYNILPTNFIKPHSQAKPTWTDIIGDPANILATFPDGVEGQWIPTAPQGVATEFPLNRKGLVITGKEWSDLGDGTDWQTSATILDSVNNTISSELPTVGIMLLHYETQAHFTRDDVNSKVIDLGTVFANKRSTLSRGNLLNSSLLGKVSVGTLNVVEWNDGNVYGQRYLETGIIATTINVITHNTIELYESTESFACKTLDYLSSENGVLKLNYAYKEMVYDVTWGDNAKFEITDNQSTLTDDNGNTVLYGTASFNTQYFIVEE